MIGSSQIANSSKTLRLSLLSAKMKNIRSKMKALECSQHYKNQFIRRSRADYSKVGGGIWPKFELIQDFMHVLVGPARIKMIQSKMKELEWSQHFSHFKSMGIFPDPQGKLTPQSVVRSGQISKSFETLWLSSLPAKMNIQ